MPAGSRGAGTRARLRTPQLLAPVGRSLWGMATALALVLGVLLSAPGEVGSAMALGFVLTAVPSLPSTWRAAVATMSVRAVTVVAGAALVVWCGGSPVAWSVAIVAAAMAGAAMRRVGATAGLAVVLIAIDSDGHLAPSGLAPYAIGAAAVFVAWAAWSAAASAIRLARRLPPRPAPPAGSWRIEWAHVARVGVAMAVAVVLAGMLPAELVGGHWLITSVLLTIQPGRADTGMRLAQRLSGNAVGAVIAAVLLGSHPPAPVAVAATLVLFLLAVALRPVNYTWWAVTGPPVLLVISEYPELFPWYEGGVRLAMNLAGAAIVVAVVFGLPAARYRLVRKSDSVYKIQG